MSDDQPVEPAPAPQGSSGGEDSTSPNPTATLPPAPENEPFRKSVGYEDTGRMEYVPAEHSLTGHNDV